MKILIFSVILIGQMSWAATSMPKEVFVATERDDGVVSLPNFQLSQVVDRPCNNSHLGYELLSSDIIIIGKAKYLIEKVEILDGTHDCHVPLTINDIEQIRIWLKREDGRYQATLIVNFQTEMVTVVLPDFKYAKGIVSSWY